MISRAEGSDGRNPVEAMLEARSVAVVGASVKEGSLGWHMMAELRRGGFEGTVYPVNPSYDEVDGHPCYASMIEVPERVDLAILGVANARIERAMTDAAAAGARSAVMFSSLFEQEPPAAGLPPLSERLAAIAREHGMALCGGNGMGFLNLERSLRATGFPTPADLRRGSVTFISHSGSAFAALAFNDRGIGFNILVSPGNEIVTGMAEYMEYALGLDSTKVVALLLETVREPDRFRAALGLAAEREVPVLALKVGRAERSKAMVTAHSGALAGEHGAYEALFDAYGVVEVRALDELADAVELFSSPRRAPAGGIASVHDSGGERAMFVDLAADLGVRFSAISNETRSRMQDVLEPGLVAENPLDAWGTGLDHERIFIECLAALADDPDTAVIAFVVDLTRQGEPYDEGYLEVALRVFEKTDKPFCVLSNLASAVALEEAAMLRNAGIPVLEGTSSGLLALRHLLEHRDMRARPPIRPPEPVAEAVRDRWRERLSSGAPVGELEATALLADYGIPVVETEAAGTEDEAADRAGELGFPVAMKTAEPGIAHKSDVSGVKLGIADAPALRAAYRELAERIGPRVTVSRMAPRGVELALGIVRDEQFGPLVVAAAGGVLVELLRDRRLAIPPLDDARAIALLERLRVRPLLEGVRGEPPADVASVGRALSRLSLLAGDLGESLDALDVNPMIVSHDSCVAVDALVIPRSGGTPTRDAEPTG